MPQEPISLPRYRLIQPPLSETRMSIVYRATDNQLNDRPVVVKMLSRYLVMPGIPGASPRGLLADHRPV